MTRRDTIIVAALINAGLLVVLFVSALKNEEAREELVVKKEEVVPAALPEPAFRTEAKQMMGDEVDLVLKQYNQPNPLSTATLSPVEGKESAAVSAPLAFSEELKTSLEPVTPARVETSTPTEALYKEVIVKKGDVLEKIARQHHTTVSEIMKATGLSSTQLKIGQVLKVPSKTSKVAEVVADKTPLSPTSAKYYTVKPGDNPWTIAVKNHIKVEELLKLNHMDEAKARKLKPGDQIRIR